ncbi:zf-HC2 domain-containing protein [Paragemmobacter ruber]|uniref:Putative zinc-finger domain-containing protein n=1 Tax=Paragemmobacter ruber TaxID=1985673 RepID=A0ABW9Y9X1_9RHOB|nr:zf-HC2 domain-containing protein [Rhodobacter ruber]NBE08540.1 hypothetical protein [Rhodobacter ruber]
MTPPPAMDRTRLAAFVDGELSPEEAAAVVMHLARNPDDQAYVDDLFAANAALAQAFAAPMGDPLPAPLDQAIRGTAPASAQVIAFRPRAGLLAGALALAASLAAAVLLFRPMDAQSLAAGPVPSGSPLAEALATLPSGTPLPQGEGRDLMILSTLPTDTGPCREVEALDRRAARMEVALACLDPARGWSIAVVLQEPLLPAGEDDAFLPAEGAAAEGLSAYLDQRGAGLALSPEEEAALIARNWAQ